MKKIDKSKFEKTPIGIRFGELKKPLKFQEISTIKKEEIFLSTIGKVFKIEKRATKNDSMEYSFFIVDLDFKDSLMVKKYAKSRKEREQLNEVKEGQWILFQGKTKLDTYKKREMYLNAYSFQQLKGYPKNEDNAEVKRVELHLHTKMSTEDGIISPETLIEKMLEKGYSTIAITDQDCTQALPIVYNKLLKEKRDFKVINGVEMTTINEENFNIKAKYDLYKDKIFVVFDIETTGLDSREDKLIELGAVKVKNGIIIEEFQTLINPEIEISKEITKITKIKDSMVADSPTMDKVLPTFLEFIGDYPLVAHNINFDGNFIKNQCYRNRLETPTNEWIDTLELARLTLPNNSNHKLDTLVRQFKIELENHHRALDDAKATMQLFYKLLELPITFNAFNTLLYMRNDEGRNNMNQLMTKSFIDYLEKSKKLPLIPKFEIENYRENLIVASSGIDGEVFLTLLREGKEKAKEVAKFYDFLEVHPIEQYLPLIKFMELETEEQIIKMIKNMIEIGEELNIPVVATGNVKHIEKEDYELRRSMLQTIKRQHSFVPNSYLLTTEEMLEEFDFLTKEKAYEIVVINSNLIADMIKKVQILPDRLMIPHVVEAEEEVEKLALERFETMYGINPHPIALERLNVELNAILGRNENSNINYSVLYWIALKTVQKSRELGYMVGSRGSVGSSFLAFILGITDVNSLAPHYVCPSCHNTEFLDRKGSGIDLEDKECPVCNTIMNKDGHNIPFESFVGEGRVKPPDIDLNFSGDVQSLIHDYIAELFGMEFVFKAGTISTIKEKMIESITNDNMGFNVEKTKYHLYSETMRFREVEGVKRTTGQHAGGLIIFPKEIDPLDWMPFQHSAHDVTKPVTTHYDYHSLEESFIKIDALGHDSPTIAKMYEEAIGINYEDIAINDTNVINTLFREDMNSGISEFLTPFVAKMLNEIQPKNFDELVRISGLSHGTNVWHGNAKSLIDTGVATIEDVIACRDDIMLDLIDKGVSKEIAFAITDKVRKGKGIDEEYLSLLKEKGVTDWYIKSCQLIKYMFPKAHAVAYTNNSVKQAWVKYYHPEVFYSVFFTMKAKGFKWEIVDNAIESIANKISKEEEKELREIHKNNPILLQEVDKLTTIDMSFIEYRIKQLEKIGQGMHHDDENVVVEDNSVYRADDKQEYLLLLALREATEKDIKIGKVDFYLSHPTEFRFRNGTIIPPLCTIKYLGSKSSVKFADYRDITEFKSFKQLWIKENKEDILLDKRALINFLKYGNLTDIFKTEEIEDFLNTMKKLYLKKEQTNQIKSSLSLITTISEVLEIELDDFYELDEKIAKQLEEEVEEYDEEE